MAMTADQLVSAAGLISSVSERLSRGDLAERRREARLLLALALERAEPVLPHEDIFFPPKAETRLEALISRRNEGEPVSRLRGWREFYSLRFYLNNATLDPRADSEVLVDTGLTLASEMDGPLNIVDFGTGSGCLLLAMLHHLRDAQGLGVDISPDAIDAARRNATALALDSRASWIVSDWDASLGADMFDLVISNPPYIARDDIETLAPEVRLHDPLRALDGGADGLEVWRRLLPVITRRLKPGGVPSPKSVMVRQNMSPRWRQQTGSSFWQVMLIWRAGHVVLSWVMRVMFRAHEKLIKIKG